MIDYPDDMLLSGMKDTVREGTQDEQSTGESGVHQPIIGIPVPVQQGHQGPLLLADAVGAWAVERMQGRVFLIPLWPFPTHKHVYQSLWSLMLSMDGLLLPADIAGTDWYTHWQEREQHPGPQTWPLAWEIALAQLATFLHMPILSIADGAIKWNIALGGKGVPSHMSPTTPENWDRHTIRVRAPSKLAGYLQPALAVSEGEQKPWELAFMHQQGVEKLATGLRSCAQTEETAVVAFERRDAAFGLGILGRLDWGLDQIYGTTIFEAFLHACRSFDRARQQHDGWESSRDTICATVSDLVTHEQPLIPVPVAPQEERPRRSGHLSSPLALSISSNGSTGQQERLRQRSQQLTKEEMNRRRRQRLKMMSR